MLTVALFRAMSRGPGGVILEANMSQTIGSASSSLASGTIFTIPALFLWGMAPPLWQVAGLAFLGAILGITAMVPLRRLLIVKSAAELPYPEGTACAEVLRATTAASSGGRWIFIGLTAGAVIKLALGAAALIPSDLGLHLPVLPKAELGAGDRAGAARRRLHPRLPAVGDHGVGEPDLGPGAHAAHRPGGRGPDRAAVPGGDDPDPRPLGRPDLVALRALHRRRRGGGGRHRHRAAARSPPWCSSLRAVVRGLRGEGVGPDGEGGGPVPRTDRDVPGWVVLAGPAVVVLALVSIPGLIAGEMSLVPRIAAALGVGIFGVLFVVVSSRIVGLIGVSSNPTSGMTLVTLLGVSVVFVLFGWDDPSARAAILTVGTVVCIAASKAGDISQDLKTGYLVGATPARQQAGQFLGAAFACWAVAARRAAARREAYTFGSPELPAPQATLMKTVIDGVLSGSLPWGLVGTGAALAVSAMLAGLPGLAFAVGIYLPLASLTPIFLGGVVRRIVDARQGGAAVEGDAGVLAASGMIAGEGLAGVAIALLFRSSRGTELLTGPAATALGIALVLGIGGLLYRAGTEVKPPAAVAPGAE